MLNHGFRKKRRKINEATNDYGMRLVNMTLDDAKKEEIFEKNRK